MAVRLAVVLVGLAVLVVGGARFMPAARAQESRGAGSDGRTFSGPLDSSAVSGSAAPSEEAAESADAADDAEGPSEAEEPAAEAQAEASEADAAAPDEQGEEGSPADEPASEGEDAAGDAPTGDGEGSEEKKEDDNLISLSFKNTPMEKIATFLSEKKNKPVIPHEEIRNTRLTIVATQKMALPEAMLILHEALRQHGVVIEEGPRVINLRPVKDIAQASLEVIGADESLETIEDPSRIVRKVFSVEHYDVVRLKDAVVPMLPEFGEVVADPNSRKLMVRDAVSNLRRIEQLIRTLDVPMADQTMKQIIKLESADATWMVGVLKTMIETEPRSRERSRSGRENGPAVAIEQAAGRVLLVPEVTRNWIIAVAPADTMEQIRAWVEQLDKPAADEEAVRFHAVEYANPEDVARTITQALSSMPDFRQSVQVTSVPQSRRILVYGSPRGQELVEQLLAEVDVEDANERVREVIELDYADAEEVATNIEELFSNREVSYQTNSYTRYRYDQEAVQVRVIADTTRNAVTVIADPSTLGEIRKMVEEQWDVPIDTEDVQPRVYTLTYADSVQLRELLESLFSERSEGGSNLWDYYYGRGGDEATPVGRLYGQFSFQVMEDTNKLVVTTKNAAHYEVIDRLVKELDVPQEAGLPQIVHLQHANAEDLAEQLNAVLSQPGTLAEIRRNQRDLSDGPRVSDIAAAMDTNSDNNSRGRGDEADPDVMTFWWQRSRQAQDEAPLTNLVGSIRVVPVYRRNALLIVAPPAYLEP
ncbi:MAG: secretin N-terminal domain-containing protein, partial [Phycisphaeraceae bacterium]